MTSLKHRAEFRRLWAGDAAAQFATMTGLTILPLIPIQHLGAGPLTVGVLTAAETFGFGVVGLPAGVWVDRWDKRRLMLVAAACRAVLFASITTAWALGLLTVAHLLVVAVTASVCAVFFDLSYQSLLPSLIDDEELVAGNAKLTATQSAAFTTGPVLAGGLVQAVGLMASTAVLGMAHTLSALSVWRIRTKGGRPGQRRPMGREITEGWRFVAEHSHLRPIMAFTAAVNLFGGAQTAVLVLFLVRDAGLSAFQLGAIFTTGGVGGLVAAAVTQRLAAGIGDARVLVLLPSLAYPTGLCLVVAPVGPIGLALAVAAYCAIGFAGVAYNVIQIAYRQRICPSGLIGRVNATMRAATWTPITLGALAGGALAQTATPGVVVLVSAAGSAVAPLILLRSPLARVRALPL